MGFIHFIFSISVGVAGARLRSSPTTTGAAPAPAHALLGDSCTCADGTSGVVTASGCACPAGHGGGEGVVAGFQQLRSLAEQFLEGSAASAAASNLRREDGTSRADKVAGQEGSRETWGDKKGNLGSAPAWYSTVPRLHKQLNDASGLHDIYELGRAKTATTTSWELDGNVDWFKIIPPNEVTWQHVRRKIDELRGGSKGLKAIRYPPVPTTVAPTKGTMEYEIGAGAMMRMANFTLRKEPKGHHTPLPPTRKREPVVPIPANHLVLGGHRRNPADLRAPDVWNQLSYLLNKTGVKLPPPRPKRQRNHTIEKFEKPKRKIRRKRSVSVAKRGTTPRPLRHLRIPPTRPPVELENFDTTTVTTTFDMYLASLEGLDKVLYMMDQMIERMR